MEHHGNAETTTVYVIVYIHTCTHTQDSFIQLLITVLFQSGKYEVASVETEPSMFVYRSDHSNYMLELTLILLNLINYQAELP